MTATLYFKSDDIVGVRDVLATVRARTSDLAAPLSAEDVMLQSMETLKNGIDEIGQYLKSIGVS